MGREANIPKKFWMCTYCREKGHERKIYRPERVIGHVFIYILEDGEVDCHGPLHNTVFMDIVIKYLKSVTRKYRLPWWKVLLNKIQSRFKKGV